MMRTRHLKRKKMKEEQWQKMNLKDSPSSDSIPVFTVPHLFGKGCAFLCCIIFAALFFGGSQDNLEQNFESPLSKCPFPEDMSTLSKISVTAKK